MKVEIGPETPIGSLAGHDEAKPGRPTLARAAQITDQLLAAAEGSFLSKGYDATSMSGIARSVGVPKTTLYKRYPDKAALLRAVVDRRMESWSQAAGSEDGHLPTDLHSLLGYHVSTMLHWATKSEVRAIGQLAANLPVGEMGTIHPGRSFEGHMKEILIRVVVQHGPASGIHSKDPEAIVDFLMSVTAGVVARLAPGVEISKHEAAARAEGIVAIAAGGSAVW